jgi:hypothetical protein
MRSGATVPIRETHAPLGVRHSRSDWQTLAQAVELAALRYEGERFNYGWCALLATAQFEQLASFDPNAGFRALPLDESLYDHPVAWHLIAPLS